MHGQQNVIIIHSVFQLSFEACTSQVQIYTFTQTLLLDRLLTH